MSSNRITFIDLAKGVAIFLVLVGHVDTIQPLKSFIYSFHMPLFFLLSGYFMNFSRGMKEEARKMFRSIIVPYLVMGGAIWIAYSLINRDFTFSSLINIPLVTWKYNGEVHSVGAIWFLPTLYLGKLWLLLCSKRKGYYLYIILGALFSLLLTKITKCVLPFAFQQALTCAPFMLIGSHMKKIGVFERDYNPYLMVGLSLAFLIYTPSVSVAMRVNSMTAFGYVTASLISFLIIYWLKQVEIVRSKVVEYVCKFFTWCGRYSLIILCIHSVEAQFEWCTLPHNLFVVEILVRWCYIILLTWMCTKISFMRKVFNIS